MITDEDALALVKSLHETARANEKHICNAPDEARRAWLVGRANAYRLAARRLKKLISDKEADGE